MSSDWVSRAPEMRARIASKGPRPAMERAMRDQRVQKPRAIAAPSSRKALQYTAVPQPPVAT